MGTQPNNQPPLLGYFFVSLAGSVDAAGNENFVIQTTGQLVAREGDYYVGAFAFADGKGFSRLIGLEELASYTLFPTQDAQGDFIQDFHRRQKPVVPDDPIAAPPPNREHVVTDEENEVADDI